jgi:excisionase family DNA binding protein
MIQSLNVSAPDPERRFLTVTEAAVWLAVSERTIYDALRSGRIRGIKIGRLWRIREEWIEKWGSPNWKEG